MRVSGLLACSLVTVALLAGCAPEGELKTASQANDFIDDLARGGSIDDWTHEIDAVTFADNAWYERYEIESLGTKIREEGGDWACDTAGGADKVGDLVEIIQGGESEARKSILYAAEEDGVPDYEVNSLFEEVLDLGSSEAVGTISSACDAAGGF
jgi:hypothetical protein